MKIGDEIVSYESASGTSINITERGIDGTTAKNYLAGTQVFKYELGSVSLRRINKNHNLNATTDNRDIGLDTYGIKIDMSDTSRGTNRTGTSTLPQLFFNQTKSGGGRNGRSTYNVQFEMCIPNFTYVTPTGTTIEGSMRTTSGTSVSGVEPSFFDKGFSPITFKKENYFDSPRIIASKVNEDTYLDELPGNKSMTLNVNMATSDSRLSPMIDLERTTVTYVTNRVNDIVTNYADDPRVNSVPGDPSRFIYATKPIVLENPSTSIQVLLDAYLNEDCDLRVFYAYDQPGRLEDVVYIPFPGFSNQDSSTYYYIEMNTSNRQYYNLSSIDQAVGSSSGQYYFTLSASCLADMDANDTVTCRVVHGGTSGTGPSDISSNSHWSGFLAC